MKPESLPISTLLSLLCLIVLFTLTTSQNYVIQTADIDGKWTSDLGEFVSYEFASEIPPPDFKFNFMGSYYDILLHEYGSVHFGDKFTQSTDGCCNGSCNTACDWTSGKRLINQAVFPLALETWPSQLSFSHQVFSNSTMFVYRTMMTSSSGVFAYSVAMVAPSTIIIGLETSPSGPTTIFNSAFSGIIGNGDSAFGLSPINDPSKDAGVDFPPAATYPPTTIISYPRTSYQFQKAYLFCAMGGALCPPAFISSPTLPLDLHITTNSDNACFRNLNSHFLIKLLPTPSPSVKQYPRVYCHLELLNDNNVLNTYNILTTYDVDTDTFLCTLPTTYVDPDTGTVSAVTLAGANCIRTVALNSEAAYMTSSSPFQAKLRWTPSNYQQAWPQTTQYPNPPAVTITVTADRTLLGSAPVNFPYETTGVNAIPQACHCKSLRYRGQAAANPDNLRQYQYGKGINALVELSKGPTGTPGLEINESRFLSSISDSLYKTDDYCYVDCLGARGGDGMYNNCGQCVSLSALQAQDSTITSISQALNCWGLCDNLTARNTGHYDYLLMLPAEARINGLVDPNSPYHTSKDIQIADSPQTEQPIECAKQSQVVSNAASELVGPVDVFSHNFDTMGRSDSFEISSNHTNNVMSTQMTQSIPSPSGSSPSSKQTKTNYYTMNDYENYNKQHDDLQHRLQYLQTPTLTSLLSQPSTLLSALSSGVAQTMLGQSWSEVVRFFASPPSTSSPPHSNQFTTLDTYPAGTVLGFSTERKHVSSTLALIDGFKYFAVAVAFLGCVFTAYLVYDHRAREKRRQVRRDQRKKALAGGTGRRSGTSGSNRPSSASTGGPQQSPNTGMQLITPNQDPLQVAPGVGDNGDDDDDDDELMMGPEPRANRDVRNQPAPATPRRETNNQPDQRPHRTRTGSRQPRTQGNGRGTPGAQQPEQRRNRPRRG